MHIIISFTTNTLVLLLFHETVELILLSPTTYNIYSIHHICGLICSYSDAESPCPLTLFTAARQQHQILRAIASCNTNFRLIHWNGILLLPVGLKFIQHRRLSHLIPAELLWRRVVTLIDNGGHLSKSNVLDRVKLGCFRREIGRIFDIRSLDLLVLINGLATVSL